MWTCYDAYCRNVNTVPYDMHRRENIFGSQKPQQPVFYDGDWAAMGRAVWCENINMNHKSTKSGRRYWTDSGHKKILKTDYNNYMIWIVRNVLSNVILLALFEYKRFCSLSLSQEVVSDGFEVCFFQNRACRLLCWTSSAGGVTLSWHDISVWLTIRNNPRFGVMPTVFGAIGRFSATLKQSIWVPQNDTSLQSNSILTT